MCFTYDYDWFPEVSDTTDGIAVEMTYCDECRGIIRPGDWVRRVYKQERECCRICEDEDSNPPCETCDYGETFEYVCCERCQRLRDGIRAVEIAEGCAPYEAEPCLGMLFADVRAGGGWTHYADEMRRLGLNDIAALVPPPADPEEIFQELAYADGPRYSVKRPGEYPGAYCRTLNDPADWFEVGGEG
jgi:hypothetical protein